MQSVLIVDDDPGVHDILGMYLRKEGFEVASAENGAQALERLHPDPPSLMVLDVMMPGMDGFEVCRRVQATSSVPIVFLTCRDDDLDVIVGLEMGADDYVTKPFNPREVVARVKAVLRRTQTEAPCCESLTAAGLTMSQETREAHVDGTPMRLTRKEFDILYLLASQPRVVFSREDIMHKVWGYSYDYSDVRTVDTHVKRVRRKAADAGATRWTIEAVWGTGYRFVAEG